MLTVAAISMYSGSWQSSSSVLGPWESGSPSAVAYPDSLYVGLTWSDRQPWYSRFTIFPSPFFVWRPVQRGTVLLAFDIDFGKVKFRSLGTAPGTMLNQFSMDEWDGSLRVATTGTGTGRSSAVYTYDKNSML